MTVCLNNGVNEIDRLSAVNMLSRKVAGEMIGVHGNLRAKAMAMIACCPSQEMYVRDHLAIVPLYLPRSVKYLTTAQEADLRSGLSSVVNKVMGIVAVMIREMEGDVRRMRDVIDVIQSLDDTFFLCPDEVKPKKRRPKFIVKRFVLRLRKKIGWSFLA